MDQNICCGVIINQLENLGNFSLIGFKGGKAALN